MAMGYNKNVAQYISDARYIHLVSSRSSYFGPEISSSHREKEATHPGSDTTFIHMNAVPVEELGECFERNNEGPGTATTCSPSQG